MKLICAFVFSLGLTFNCNAEDLKLAVKILETLTKEPLNNSEVVIFYGDSEQTFLTGKKSNQVDLVLPLDQLYTIRFVSEGYVSKRIEIDLSNIPEESKEGGFKLVLDMNLFPHSSEFDYAVMAEPIGKGRYDSKEDNIKWDIEHTRRVKRLIKLELERLREIYQQNYLKWKAKGDKSYDKVKYKQALKHYRKALRYAYIDDELEEKYAEIKESLNRYKDASISRYN